MSNKPKNRQPVSQQTRVSASVTQWNYPVPPAAQLDQYKDNHPDVYNLFISEWKAEAEHRRLREIQILDQKDKDLEIEANDVRSSHRNDLISMLLSFALIFGLFSATVYLAILGQSVGAIVTAIGALSAFWKARQGNSKPVQ